MSKARQLADLGNVYDDGALSNRNLIINGAMVVDQRNGGASVTGSASVAKFAADRFSLYANTTGVITIQQVSDAPVGFQKSNKITCTTAATGDTTGSRVQFSQGIEGYNVTQLELGTSNAKTMTLSFWVKASNTGTYGGSFTNGVIDKSYPYQYTINAANTWEYKTVTITGDTSGTWATDNTSGLILFWSMGVGSTYEGPANQWNGAFDIAPPSSFSLKDNLNATWQITGVQLEVGDTATPFEHRSYGDELARCQRYYQLTGGTGAAAGTSVLDASPVLSPEMRAAPTVGIANGTNGCVMVNRAIANVTSISSVWATGNTKYFGVRVNSSDTGMTSGAVTWIFGSTLSADAEL